MLWQKHLFAGVPRNTLVNPPPAGVVEFLLDAENGTNGSKNATDISGNSVPVTWYGSSAVTTAQFKDGSKSIDLRVTSSAVISIPNPNLGTDDFTIEWWERAANYQASFTTPSFNCYNAAQAGSWAVRTQNNPNNFLIFALRNAAASADLTITGSTDQPTSTWKHIAVTRSGNTITLWLDGVSQGTIDATGISVGSASSTLFIGGADAVPNTAERYDAWYDMIRITTGLARYTATFTPPDTY